MPEDLPKAILILLWLLIGVIVIGYLVMDVSLLGAAAFAAVFYGLPVLWSVRRAKRSP